MDNQGHLDKAFCYSHGQGMSDADYYYLLWAMECDGIPFALLEPIREYLRQPVPTEDKLLSWMGK